MKFILIFMLIMSISLMSHGQADSKEAKLSMAITGQVMFSGNTENIFLNFGGGGLTMKVKSSAVSINFLPSLRYNFGTEKISPTLGFGPQWYFRNKLIIGVPLYYLEGSWKVSFGIGYKFPLVKG